MKEIKEGATTYFIYDGDNRLTQAVVASTQCVATSTYHYDPFGRRISKCVDGTTTYFMYSDEGLVAEFDSTGNIAVEYGWQPDGIWGTSPVFQKRGSDYYWYENDHLGTPQKMTDSSGAVVWSATYEAFGKATVSPSSTIENNLRFPGQYFDRETGLHQNWHRDYMPTTGKYSTEDPFMHSNNYVNNYEQGSMLGKYYVKWPKNYHLYQYTKSNPINFRDVAGLWCGSGWSEVAPDDFDGWSFSEACRLHDVCYSNCREWPAKSSCDMAFLRNMQTACLTIVGDPEKRLRCLRIAEIYYTAVVRFGQVPFDTARLKCMCILPYPRVRF